MVNAFDVFRIMLGLLASFFILYFLIFYSGIYSQMQENTQRMLITNNFKKAVEDVYLTGNSVTFEYFSKLKFDTVFNGLVDPAVIRTKAGQNIIMTPVIFLPGDKLFIEKKSLDYGWWKFHFVEALPELDIIFNPREINDEVRSLMKSIANLFPETTGRTPKIRFGFCDGSLLVKPCNGELCEGFAFLFAADQQSAGMSQCNLIPNAKQRLVIISQQCSSGLADAGSGVCIMPLAQDSRYGYAYVKNSTGYFVYKTDNSMNSIDLLSIIVGGSEKAMYGPIAENLYTYENRMFSRELELMARIAAARALLVSAKLPLSEEKMACFNYYANFLAALETIPAIVSENEGEYYRYPGSVSDLVEALNNADSAYQNLVNLGCEYTVD